MARPEEKAQAMLNKWTKMRDEYNEIGVHKKKTRPYLASLCDTLYEAERWRRQIIREIGVGIREIQNPGMGEHAIRDLNDKINKLFREKYWWNKRIVELSGPNYNAIERKRQREEGNDTDELIGSGGYRYFGAAKDLPGVKELFAKEAAATVSTKRKRAEISKNITPAYYGICDEDDGILLHVESEQFKKDEQKLLRELDEHMKSCSEQGVESDLMKDKLASNKYFEEKENNVDSGIFSAQIVISQDMLARIKLEHKKQHLLKKLTV